MHGGVSRGKAPKVENGGPTTTGGRPAKLSVFARWKCLFEYARVKAGPPFDASLATLRKIGGDVIA